MFAVFGKSLQKEELRKSRIGNKRSPLDRFNSDKSAYPVSPNYTSIDRCFEFIALAKKYNDIKCLYIAEEQPVFVGEQPKINKKNGKQVFKFKKIQNVPNYW